MLQVVLIAITFGVASLLLKPLVILLKLKLYFKKDAVLRFKESLRALFLLSQGSITTQEIVELAASKPDARFILSLRGRRPLIYVLDPLYTARLYQDIQLYAPLDRTHRISDLYRDSLFSQFANDLLHSLYHAKQPKSVFLASCSQAFVSAKLRLCSEASEWDLSQRGLDLQDHLKKLVGLALFRFCIGEIESDHYARAIHKQFLSGAQDAQQALRRFHLEKTPVLSWLSALTEEREREGKRSALLDFLMEDLRVSKRNTSREQACDYLLAAVLSGTVLVTRVVWECLEWLSRCPEHLGELRREIKSAGTKASESDVSQLLMMGSLIDEILRLRSIRGLVELRRVTREHYLLDLKLGKNWYLGVIPSFLSRSSKHYEEAERVELGRWLSVSPVKNDNGYVFVPFGAGPNACIGDRMSITIIRMMLMKILTKYNIAMENNSISLKLQAM